MTKRWVGRLRLGAICRFVALAAAVILGVIPVAIAQPAPPAVLVAPAQLKDVSNTATFVGRVKAVDKVELRARVSGYLGPRLFKEGEQVPADKTVFTLDPAPFEAVVGQRRADVAAATAALALADLQARRGRELIKTKTIPQSELDLRETALLRARASLDQAKAAEQAAEVDLSYTQIKAPIAGRIGQAAFSPGNLVGPDSGVLATVVRQNPVQVVFNVSQRQLLAARRDAPQSDLDAIVARLQLADGSTYDQPGHIDFLGVQADPNTDSVPLRAVFANPKDLLADGMSVRVVLQLGKPVAALVIPQAAIAQDQAGTYVFVVDPQNKVTRRPVKVQIQRDGSAVVKDGLAAGDRVIVQGQARVRPGIVVAPSAAPPA
ncbi:MAG: efflux RND transporter periplasmic adaptor subunit [Stellaceae bacterium]